MREQTARHRLPEPTLFMTASGQELVSNADQYQKQLDMPIWPLFDDISAESQDAIMDFFNGQGIHNFRDLLLLDPLLSQTNSPYNMPSIRGRAITRLEYLPWRLDDKPSVQRDTEMCRTLNDVPLQVAFNGLFGRERHRLVGDHRITVADALADTSNFRILCSSDSTASSMGEKALRYALEFNKLKGYTLSEGENPYALSAPAFAAEIPPLLYSAVAEHVEKFGTDPRV